MVTERKNPDEVPGEENKKSPGEKIEFQERGVDFLGEKLPNKLKTTGGGFDDKSVSYPKHAGNFSSQAALTLTSLCENSKLGLPEKDVSGQPLLTSLGKFSGNYKGKEIAVPEDPTDEGNGNNSWVERDFLLLSENRGNSSKREAENGDNDLESQEKKPKVESLNLSLALPDVSLSLAGSNRAPNVDLPSRHKPSWSVHSLDPSCNNMTTMYSNSYSYSHQFSHNPSCSLTRNSSDNYDCSAGSHHIWNCGEGTNGSVHSRFRPVGDGSVALSNHGGGGGLGFGMSNRNGFKDSNNNSNYNNSLYRAMSSDNVSFLPSELPARLRADAQSGDLRESEEAELTKARRAIRPERILREIVSESVPIMAQIMQELTEDTVQSVKLYLKNLIKGLEMRDELAGLQRKLDRRSDLSRETLFKCHRSQIEILVAIKMGLAGFLSNEAHVSVPELVDIFLLEKCRNLSCRRPLPVEDCDCKICSARKGFCSECMCPVCFNFDCASNTCSWVGCDACSHWCHAVCGLEQNLIKPSHRLKKGTFAGGTEMQFHCLGCGHASEMFGFVKEVFLSCAKDWSLENLMKELDCVRKIFGGSEDQKGKELHIKAEEMLSKLRSKMMSPPEVCASVFQFFSSSDSYLDMGPSVTPLREVTGQPSFGKDVSTLPLSVDDPVASKLSFYNCKTTTSHRPDPSNGLQPGPIPFEFCPNDLKIPITTENKVIEDSWSVKPPTTKRAPEGLGSLESLVRIKEAEARMFMNRAKEAQAEIESYKRMVRLETEKLEQEYAEKRAGLGLQETEERRRKKMEDLKALENSHCDYYKMKMRMQSEISSLLKRMEATKQLLV